MFNKMVVPTGSGGGSMGYTVVDTPSTSGKTFDLGFVPKMVLLYTRYLYSNTWYVEVFKFDVEANKIYQTTNDGNGFDRDNTSYWGAYITVNGTQVTYKAPDSAYTNNASFSIVAY